MKKDKFMAAMKTSKQMAKKKDKTGMNVSNSVLSMAGKKKTKRNVNNGIKLSFKAKDMTSFAEKPNHPIDSPKKYYPSITVDAKDVSIDDSKVGDKVTLHAHSKVKRVEDTEDGKKITLEIQKGDAKYGHNPSGDDFVNAMKKTKNLTTDKGGEKKVKRTWYLSPKDVPKKGKKVDKKKLKQYPDSEDDVEWTE